MSRPSAAAAGAGGRARGRLRPLLAAAATAMGLLVILALVLPRHAGAPVPPPPAHWFNDDAALVSPAFAAAKNAWLEANTRATVAVLTARGAPGEGIEAYASNAATAWRIGAARDNGLFVLVLPDVRTVRVEVGYGLEAALPDVDAGRLADATLMPAFERGDYERGFDEFLAALFRHLDARAADAPVTARGVGLYASFAAALREVPRAATRAAAAFAVAPLSGRLLLALAGGALVAFYGALVAGVLQGAVALVQVPWRLVHGHAWRAIDRQSLARELAPAAFVARPPPSLVAAARELGLPHIAWGACAAVAIVVFTVFLALGSDLLVGDRGAFGGAGVTRHWR